MSSRIQIRRLVFIALFAALFILLSAIKLNVGITPVPFTLQTLGVVLAGVFLGGRDGFLSIALVLALTATGLPLLHGQGGWSLIVGPTGGFLWIFPFCALLTGYVSVRLLRSRLAENRVLSFIVLFIVMELFGSFLAYVGGIPWLMHVTGLSFAKAMTAGCYPYLPGDAVKNVVAAAAAVALRNYLPSLHRDSAPYNGAAGSSY
ncbi:biotin transporter BioY [Paenibacillus beijingensis]|uniref:Biotin transporter n=1 Tax=Paenibacillus beijingensis TaxID=1126833 RepID=A0A0D5NMX1_9BACL|nr:biotin transporter BioY [Paenibacillus beijingensis]AJY76644.1 biotin biosynthesis protein BioY [Paenibacillus beijingensis]